MTVIMLFVSKLLATLRPGKWLKPGSISSSSCAIVRVRVYVVLKRTVDKIID